MLAMVMGIMINSIYELWFLCGDLVYVILFPQLVSVIYLESTNTYGSLAGYVIGILLRLLGGENAIGLPAAIKYPGYVPRDEEKDVDAYQRLVFSRAILILELKVFYFNSHAVLILIFLY